MSSGGGGVGQRGRAHGKARSGVDGERDSKGARTYDRWRATAANARTWRAVGLCTHAASPGYECKYQHPGGEFEPLAGACIKRTEKRAEPKQAGAGDARSKQN